MAGISATYPAGGGFRTDVSGIPGIGGGGGQDMGWLMDLAKRRAQQKLNMGQLELDASRKAMREAERPHPTLSAAPPSQYGQMMSAARGQADAESLLKGQQLRDMMQAKSTVFDPLSTLAMRGAGSGILGAEQQYGQLPVAASVTGVQLPQTTGWDRYAALAAGSPGASSAAVENQALQAQLGQAGQQGGGIDQYLNSLRMYQPAVYRQLMSQKQG